jgi:hypothetical protein
MRCSATRMAVGHKAPPFSGKPLWGWALILIKRSILKVGFSTSVRTLQAQRDAMFVQSRTDAAKGIDQGTPPLAETGNHCATKTTRLTVAAVTNARGSRSSIMFLVRATNRAIPPVPCRAPRTIILYLIWRGYKSHIGHFAQIST